MLVKDLLDHAIFITDGTVLCETLHSRGINIRYLGYFLELVAQHETLSYIYVIINIIIGYINKRGINLMFKLDYRY